MALTHDEQILRNEALKFYKQVYDREELLRINEPKSPEIPIVGGEEVKSVEAAEEFCHKFIQRVNDRFAAGEGETFRRFLEAVLYYNHTRSRITEIYVEVFILFIGHADLFYDFEQSLNDGSEATRKEIKKLRAGMKRQFERFIDDEMKLCRSATRKMEQIQKGGVRNPVYPELDYIFRTWCCEVDDPETKKERMFQMLIFYFTRRVCHLVVPYLKERHEVLGRMRAFVLAYFNQVSSLPVAHHQF